MPRSVPVFYSQKKQQDATGRLRSPHPLGACTVVALDLVGCAAIKCAVPVVRGHRKAAKWSPGKLAHGLRAKNTTLFSTNPKKVSTWNLQSSTLFALLVGEIVRGLKSLPRT